MTAQATKGAVSADERRFPVLTSRSFEPSCRMREIDPKRNCIATVWAAESRHSIREGFKKGRTLRPWVDGPSEKEYDARHIRMTR